MEADVSWGIGTVEPPPASFSPESKLERRASSLLFLAHVHKLLVDWPGDMVEFALGSPCSARWLMAFRTVLLDLHLSEHGCLGRA